MWAAAAGRRVASVVLRRSWESLCTQGQRALFTAGFRECEDRSDNDRMRERGGAAEVIARGWQVSPESESDWRSHAAAVARSIDLIKARLEWKKLLARVQELDVELAKPNLWENAAKAGQFSRERGALSGQVKSVISMEDELLEHVGLAELAHEENDTQVVTVRCNTRPGGTP